LRGYSAKEATLAANHRPEPLSNIARSFAEGILVASGAKVWVSHPPRDAMCGRRVTGGSRVADSKVRLRLKSEVRAIRGS